MFFLPVKEKIILSMRNITNREQLIKALDQPIKPNKNPDTIVLLSCNPVIWTANQRPVPLHNFIKLFLVTC